MKPMNRFALFMSQVVFSVITPFLLMPSVAKLRIIRSLIAFCFGRLYGKHYNRIIDSFQGRYGLTMAEGLAKVKETADGGVSLVVDCGTGTGFVTRQAAEYFPRSTFIAFDLLPGMLQQARDNCKEIGTDVFHVQADVFSLPLADESADLILAQNTMPCFKEFARVCRPGGIVLYVDTAAGWIANLAKRLIEKQRLFGAVRGGRADIGFYVLAQKAGGKKSQGLVEGKTRQERLAALLRCPLDNGNLVIEREHLICAHRHEYSICDGIPVMLAKGDRPRSRQEREAHYGR